MHTAQDVCLYALHIEMLHTTRVNNAKFVEICFCFLFWFLVERVKYIQCLYGEHCIVHYKLHDSNVCVRHEKLN